MQAVGSYYCAWRAFEALDVEERLKGRSKEYDVLAHNSALDIACNPIKPLSDRKVVLSPDYDCVETIERITPFLKDIRTAADYNGLNVVCDFIRFCKQERDKNPRLHLYNLFHRFKPDSRTEFRDKGGTICVGTAWEIQRRLQENGWKGEMALRYCIWGEPPIHAEVMLPCRDGLVLINGAPELFVTHPIQPDEEVPKMLLRKADDMVVSYLMTQPAVDPDHSVMKWWMVSKDTWHFPVWTRVGEDRRVLKVNITKKMVTFTHSGRKYRIPFTAFSQTDLEDPSTRRVDKSLLSGGS